MDVVSLPRPGNVIARVNPKFVRKKRQRLPSHILTLGTSSCLPLGIGNGRKYQERAAQNPREDRHRKPSASQHFHIAFFGIPAVPEVFRAAGIPVAKSCGRRKEIIGPALESRGGARE